MAQQGKALAMQADGMNSISRIFAKLERENVFPAPTRCH